MNCKPRYWQCTANPAVVLKFDTMLDNASMEDHPEYREVKADGMPVAKVRSEQREDWNIPVTRVSGGGPKKGK